jgi:hypothetical protein
MNKSLRNRVERLESIARETSAREREQRLKEEAAHRTFKERLELLYGDKPVPNPEQSKVPARENKKPEASGKAL